MRLRWGDALLEPVTGSFAVYAHRYMSPFAILPPRHNTGLCGWRRDPKLPPLGPTSSSGFRRWRSGIPALIAVGLVALANQPGCGAPVW